MPPCYACKDCFYTSCSKRKRGKKGGIRQRLKRRGFRPPLPSIILANVRSIRNKLDEVSARVRYDYVFRESCIICFTETWLAADDNEHFTFIEGFSCVRSDRTDESKKTKGGGLCIYINERYCNNYTVIKRMCSPELELLALSIRPFYLPREFGVVYIVLVYVPPTANNNVSAEYIAEVVHDLQSKSPDAPVIILGDFNKCRLKDDLPSFHQHVTCPTRDTRMLDLCYSNIAGAYIARERSPIGSSDHQTIHLLATYRTILKKGKILKKNIREWTDGNILKLQGCSDCTDWDIFKDSSETLDEWVDAVTSYIKFCENECISTKNIQIYPNNKPWINAKIKHDINRKKKAFMSGDRQERKRAQRDLNVALAEGRKEYQIKLESSLQSNNIRQSWDMINKMAGVKRKKSGNNLLASNEVQLANELNDFYCRFDSRNFKDQRLKSLSDVIVDSVDTHVLEITPEEVLSIFENVNTKKACGPDGLEGRVLKSCAKQLVEPFLDIFSTSLNNHVIPSAWKSSNIIPVPKIVKPLELNDYRPVALTSILCKCLERIVKRFLILDLETKLDPLQFAYQRGKGVDDAKLYILNSIIKHLDLPDTYARLLFVDFSSAFNTIQIHILIEKMKALKINPHIILWANEFLTQRSQRVKINSTISRVRTIDTGTPQGAVTSPIWYILYTNDFRARSSTCSISKYADDSVLLGLFFNSSDQSDYENEIVNIENYCKENFLQINVKKTKELVIHFCRGNEDRKSVLLAGESVELVHTFKYLGTFIDSKLTFGSNTDYCTKKAQQRLRLLRKLSFFNISKKALTMFYQAHICSILTFSISAWFGNLSVKNKNRLNKVLNAASKIIGNIQEPLWRIFERTTLKKAQQILETKEHPLNLEFILLPSQRRYRSPPTKTNRHKHSFVPMAIQLLNRK